VKLYADEPGFEAIRSIDLVAVSCMCRVEVPAALWRKQRMDEIDETDASTLVRAFEADYFARRFVIVDITAGVLDAAARLVAVHGLRAYDGVQLASAVGARGADPECSSFACFDDDLSVAAGAEGFALV
jgi:predicted nucleic acid-binding protein